MVKILGLVDLFAAVILLSIGARAHIPLWALIFVLTGLVLKASISILDIGSITDLAIAVLIVLSVFSLAPWQFLLIGAILMIVKGLMSLFA